MTKHVQPIVTSLFDDEPYHFWCVYPSGNLKRLLRCLTDDRAQIAGKSAYLPTRTIQEAILAFGGGHIIRANYSAWYTDSPLLLVDKAAIPTQVTISLLEAISSAIYSEFTPTLGDQAVAERLRNISSTDLIWKEETVALQGRIPGGRSFVWDVQPYLIADRLTRKPLTFGGRQLLFRRVIRPDGAEVQSFPVAVAVPKSPAGDHPDTAYVSFFIRLNNFTIPGSDRLYTTATLGLRRWWTWNLIGEDGRLLAPWPGVQLYVKSPYDWVLGTPTRSSFVPIQLETGQGNLRYAGSLVRVLEQRTESWISQYGTGLPPVDELSTDLRRFAAGVSLQGDGVNDWEMRAMEADDRVLHALMPFSSHWGRKPGHPVSGGVSPADYYDLMLALRGDDSLVLVKPGAHVGESSRLWPARELSGHLLKDAIESGEKLVPRRMNKDLVKKLKEPKQAMLRSRQSIPAFHNRFAGQAPQILVLWSDENFRNEVCKWIQRYTGTKPTGIVDGHGRELYSGFVGSVWLDVRPARNLTVPLWSYQQGTKKPQRQELRRSHAWRRISDFAEQLPSGTPGLTGAIVELPRRTEARIPEADSKVPVRAALARLGYVNQHAHRRRSKFNPDGSVEYVEDERRFRERIKRAVVDLFRQFGILPDPLVHAIKDRKRLKGADGTPWLLAVHLLRKTSKTTLDGKTLALPIAVRIHPVTAVVEAALPGDKPFAPPEWRPYSSVLVDLPRIEWDPDDAKADGVDDFESGVDQSFMHQFTMACIRSCLDTPVEGHPHAPVLTMVDANRSRGANKLLNNGHFRALMNQLDASFPLRGDRQRVWFVRLRTELGKDVPPVVVHGNPGMRTTGLYEWEDRTDQLQNLWLGLSIGQVPDTVQEPIRQESRLKRPTQRTWNAHPVEVAVIMPDDSPVSSVQVAQITHSLRVRWPYFGDFVTLPGPLQFAKLAKEYAIGATDLGENGEEENEDIPADDEAEQD